MLKIQYDVITIKNETLHLHMRTVFMFWLVVIVVFVHWISSVQTSLLCLRVLQRMVYYWTILFSTDGCCWVTTLTRCIINFNFSTPQQFICCCYERMRRWCLHIYNCVYSKVLPLNKYWLYSKIKNYFGDGIWHQHLFLVSCTIIK